MKVGIDVSQVIYGTGVSHYTLNLLRLLPQDTMVPIGFSLRRRTDIAAAVPGAKTFPINPSLLNLLWNQIHVVPVEVFTGQVDVFHASDWTQPPGRCKKVTTIHDLAPFLLPQETDPQIVNVHKTKMKWAVRECDRFICVSQNTAADLQRVFSIPSSKISVVYEALTDRSRYAPQPKADAGYILAMGSRQKRKNIPRLISAYLKYKSRYHLPERLVIIGESDLVSPDRSVSFTGHISGQELANLFASAGVFVYPSLYEGFGLPILEAFHYQVPVVASNTSSLPEVAGKAAVLVDPVSEEELAAGIAMAVKNRAKLVAAGIKQLEKFSWEKAAAETLNIYKSL